MTVATRIPIGDTTLTRVLYFDIALDPSTVGFTAEQVAASAWAAPVWADDQHNVRVAQAVWVIESQGTTIVVDPCGASDQFLRTGPDARKHQEAVFAAMREASIDPADVDLVVLSHLDGIGMAAAVDESGGWIPAFPGARVVVSSTEGSFIEANADHISGADAFAELRAAGVVDAVDTPHRITDEIELVMTAGHSPGHCALVVESRGERALFVGHLALSPLHATAGPCESANLDPEGAWNALDALLDDAAETHTVVIGPLWPTPGAVSVGRDRSITAYH